MDKVFKIGLTVNNSLSDTDIEKINEFLEKNENYDFEVTEIKELCNGEILVVVSDV
jgi:hypothetical protein